MTQLEQLQYVEAYFKLVKRNNVNFKDPVDLASIVFYPASVGNPNYVLPSSKYPNNANLDKVHGNNDGKLQSKEYVHNVLSRGYLG